ncbi:DUF6439 family protein [Kovacikia minuta CCNUW1]|uniref:DUF6439 family protein n=1 Tax=Kovacikia minuta TaxID=2931930 RepID=UPI001CCE751C|nr:DUF6439 family protein [Kovacikia minuta]UBF26248.1 DUF6439 family protein [Kovacikia minuta CCNUW1]
MANPSISTNSSAQTSDQAAILRQFAAEELAQALLEKLAISDGDWHRLKSNRRARAGEQVAAALVFLLKNQSDEALPRLQQAIGWLDRSISAPPCPTHGDQGKIQHKH